MMVVDKSLEILKASQRAWVIRCGRPTDSDGYCGCADDNILHGLSEGARKDSESGDGTELGQRGARGKIQALHSSSALACNWFDYWRGLFTVPASASGLMEKDVNELTSAGDEFVERILKPSLSPIWGKWGEL